MKNFSLRTSKHLLFERYWLSAFVAWFFAVFAFFFVLFFANQLLFLGKSLLDLNFSLSESLLFALSSMPSALDWAFPVSLFLSLFWLLSSLVVRNELLAWQVAGVSLLSIGRFLFLVTVLFSLIFFTLNDLADRGAYHLRLKILDNWQNRVPNSWVEKNQAMTMGDMALVSLEIAGEKKVYLFQKLRERRRDYLLVQGKSNLQEEGFVLEDVELFSPALSNAEPYYKGTMERLSLNWQSLGASFAVSSYPYSFVELATKLYFSGEKDQASLKRLRLLWYQKTIAFISSLLLGVWAWFLVLDRLRTHQRAYPFWAGFVGVGLYLGLLAFSRLLMIWFWQQNGFWLLWLPVFFLLSWILFLWVKGRLSVALR